MTTNLNSNQTAVNEPRQTSPASTASTTAPLNKRAAETILLPAHPPPVGPAAKTSGPAPWLPTQDVQDLHDRWANVQAGFVDEPRQSVEQADALVAGVMKSLADSFATERSKLTGQWTLSENVPTENLRVALQRYRAFFDRLLAV